MAHRVVGIAVSGRAVRFALIETRLRRFELKGAWEADRPPPLDGWPEGGAGPDSGDLQGAPPPPRARLVDLANRGLVPPLASTDSISTSFPGERGFVRRLSFPFKETGRITATLPYQMIGLVPVQPEAIHCAFERVGTTGAGADVLAVAVPKDEFAAYLGEARADGLDPAHVALDGVCLLALVPWLGAGDEVQMLLLAEDDLVEVVVVQGGHSVVVRAVRLGEAVVGPTGEPTAAFLREVLLSVAAASEAGATVSRLRVAGPAAEALCGPLGESLSVPCEVLDPSTLPIPGAATATGLGPASVKAVALALAAAAGGGPGSLNLRTGEFGGEGAQGFFREHARFFLIAAAVFVVLGIGRGVARYIGLSSERDRVVAELKTFSKEVLGKESDDFDAVLRQVKSVSEDDLRVFPKWSAVDTLNRMSNAAIGMGMAKGARPDEELGADEAAAAGKGHALEFESIRIEPRTAAVRGEAESIDVLDGFIAKLKADTCFHDVVTENTERIQFQRHQGWQRFSLRMNVDCAPKKVAEKPKAPVAAGTTTVK